jgi:type III pantothenate kinase
VLLALDVGNTNVTVGVFDPDSGPLRAHWRLRTVHEQTADEWGILLRNLFALATLDTAAVDGIIIASVVPPLDSNLDLMARRYFHTEPVFVTAETDIGLAIRYDNPSELGADRLVNGVAAYTKYGGPCVVVDLGTAITFDVISARGEYCGGVIAAGIGISIEALFSKTARLPMVDFRPPAKLVGSSTVMAMQSGLYYGALALIDGIVERLVAELGPDTRCVATGGQAALIAHGSRYLKHVDEDLTLDGLALIWKRISRT